MIRVTDVEATPNPDALKFIVNLPLVSGGAKSFENLAMAQGDALAEALFQISHVNSVFYMDRFVTVNKSIKG